MRISWWCELAPCRERLCDVKFLTNQWLYLKNSILSFFDKKVLSFVSICNCEKTFLDFFFANRKIPKERRTRFLILTSSSSTKIPILTYIGNQVSFNQVFNSAKLWLPVFYRGADEFSSHSFNVPIYDIATAFWNFDIGLGIIKKGLQIEPGTVI